MDRDTSPWQSLADASRIDPERHGNKASRLARLGAAGFPVPDGWVLPCEAAARADADPALGLRLGSLLLEISPRTARWMLRSSSPLEDRPHRSAAGLFASVSTDATPDGVGGALLRVIASSRNTHVRQLLDVGDDAAPIAVLAQPHLTLASWWTVEIGPGETTWRAEGWIDDDGDLRVWNGSGSLEGAPREPESGPPLPVPVREAVRLAGQVAAWAGEGGWLLELGEAPAEMTVLQLRPAPARRVRVEAVSEPATPDLGAREDVPRFPLHPGDEDDRWLWDAAHSPTPVCPLLAGLFTRWLRSRPPRWPSRLIHGRWHDRARAPARPWSLARVERPPPAVERSLERWERRVRPELEGHLRASREALENLPRDPAGWSTFVRTWLRFQTTYYEDDTGEPRRWAHSVVDHLASLEPALPPAPLPETAAAQREQELDAIAGALRGREGLEGTSPEAIARWVQDPGRDPVRRRIAAFLEVHGHLAVIPWDGRSRTLREDPWPLWRELARRLGQPPSPPSRPHPWPPSPIVPELEEAARLAARVFARCEDDDDLLSEAYALFRAAAMSVAQSLDLAPEASAVVFDVLPGDLENLLRSPDPQVWREAVARGRSLASHWSAWGATSLPDDAVQRVGTAASPGRAVGPVRRLGAAREQGGPEAGEILVVPTITPADAMVFGRAAAVVCEGGDALGHASILAREHGIPAVTGLTGARVWLARAARVMVDGDAGSVTRLPGDHA